jgi:hypothetical protein
MLQRYAFVMLSVGMSVVKRRKVAATQMPEKQG